MEVGNTDTAIYLKQHENIFIEETKAENSSDHKTGQERALSRKMARGYFSGIGGQGWKNRKIIEDDMSQQVIFFKNI